MNEIYLQVCNHPELFERRDAKSPFFMNTEFYNMPVLLYNEGHLHLALPSKDHILYNKLFIFDAEYIHRALHCKEDSRANTFSFSRFIDLSPMEMNRTFVAGTLFRYANHQPRRNLPDRLRVVKNDFPLADYASSRSWREN